MSKKGTKALASATLMSLVLTTALSAGPVKAAPGQATRVGAADRYATAAQVATTNWTTSENVVLVSGEGYADAVSASALAKKLNAPILLTTAKTLSTDTKDALGKLGAKNVYVVGGEASVSTAVRTELKKTYSLVELGGANRYETNVAVAQKLVDLGVDPSSVIMVGGEGFSDALSVAPVAAAKGQILLLGMNNADYMKPVLDFVAKNKSKVTVVGTKNVISENILKTVNGTRVDGGKDRWDTNQKVLANFKDTVKMDKLYVASAAYNAKDDGYADALVASALAGKYSAPLVLVDKDGNEGTTNALSYIKNNASKSTDLQVVGGTGVVSDSLLNKITEAVNPTPNGNTKVQSIEPLSLNSFKVVYGTDVDSDSAEDVSNYKFDGSTLSSDTTGSAIKATATLQDDNRTVIVTMTTVAEQHKSYTVSVKTGVLTADKSKTIEAFDQSVEFADTTAPTLSSVEVRGNSKLKVRFSEAIKLQVDGSGKLTTNSLSKFKINGQSVTSFGVDTAYTEASDSVTTGTAVWASGVDLYFSSPLPTGNNTFKVSDGDVNAGILTDAAGFKVAETTKDFSVDKNDTKPVVKEVQCDADGTLWVRFDRPMDKKTATDRTYYGINGDGRSLPNNGKLKEGDKTIKFTGVDANFTNVNSNTLYISDSIKDAYGNKVDDDTRVSFTVKKDETKPTVVDANIIDSETIRVKFSKNIDKTSATQLTNYKLKDAQGADISDHIRVVKPSNVSVDDNFTTSSATYATKVAGWDNTDVWDIKIWKNKPATTPAVDWRLTGSKYTLTVKNLYDTTNNKNYMDEYNTNFSGTDNVAPKIKPNAYTKTNSDGKVTKAIVYFSEAMDSSSLSKLANFKYVNASGDTKDLPSTAKVTVSSDNKSVTLEFPNSYIVSDPTASVSGYDADNIVNGIIASNVSDEAGNLIDSFNNRAIVKAGSAPAITLKSNSYRAVYDGDDILVKVQYDGSIDADTLTPDAFTVAGENPDSVSLQGSDLVLRFGKDTKAASATYTGKKIKDLAFYANNLSDKAASTDIKKVDIIKAAGVNLTYSVVKSGVTDVSGAPLASETVSKVYDYQLAPKTTSDYWFATTSSAVTASAPFVAAGVASTDAVVVVSYDADLYQSSGVRPDDFRFTIAGAEVKADNVKVINNNLVFIFHSNNTAYDSFKVPGTKIVGVSLKNTTMDLSTKQDGNDGYAKYVPSNDDKAKTRLIDVK